MSKEIIPVRYEQCAWCSKFASEIDGYVMQRLPNNEKTMHYHIGCFTLYKEHQKRQQRLFTDEE